MTDFTTMTVKEKLLSCGERKLQILAKNHSLDTLDGTKRQLVPMLEKIVDDDDFPIKANYEDMNDRIYTMSKAEKKYILQSDFSGNFKLDDQKLKLMLTFDHFPIVMEPFGVRWKNSTPNGKLKLVSEDRLNILMKRKDLEFEGLDRAAKVLALTGEVDEYDF